TVLRGRDIEPGHVVVNDVVATALDVGPGDRLMLSPSCTESQALPPISLLVAGVAGFPLELTNELNVGMPMEMLDAACGGHHADTADLLLVASTGDPDAAVTEIGRAHPELRAATNQQMLGRIEQGGFTYFRQISAVLTTITVSFALLLITVLLTVSVNQRL